MISVVWFEAGFPVDSKNWTSQETGWRNRVDSVL